MKRENNSALLLLVVLLLAVSVGCTREVQRANIGHHLSSAEDVFRIQNVVFVELSNEGCSREIARQMTDSVRLAVQRRNLFLIRAVYRSDPIFEKLALPNRQPLTLAQISSLRETLKCDALIFGSVGHFRPYPNMQIGLYVNLVDLRQGRLIWGVDHIWDSSDKLIEGRIEEFFRKEMRSGYEPANWRLGLLSPRMFGKFVAHETAATLPSRIPTEEGT